MCIYIYIYFSFSLSLYIYIFRERNKYTCIYVCGTYVRACIYAQESIKPQAQITAPSTITHNTHINIIYLSIYLYLSLSLYIYIYTHT